MDYWAVGEPVINRIGTPLAEDTGNGSNLSCRARRRKKLDGNRWKDTAGGNQALAVGATVQGQRFQQIIRQGLREAWLLPSAGVAECSVSRPCRIVPGLPATPYTRGGAADSSPERKPKVSIFS